MHFSFAHIPRWEEITVYSYLKTASLLSIPTLKGWTGWRTFPQATGKLARSVRWGRPCSWRNDGGQLGQMLLFRWGASKEGKWAGGWHGKDCRLSRKSTGRWCEQLVVWEEKRGQERPEPLGPLKDTGDLVTWGVERDIRIPTQLEHVHKVGGNRWEWKPFKRHQDVYTSSRCLPKALTRSLTAISTLGSSRLSP